MDKLFAYFLFILSDRFIKYEIIPFYIFTHLNLFNCILKICGFTPNEISVLYDSKDCCSDYFNFFIEYLYKVLKS